MNDEIIKLREELVALSTDPIKTRELLDQLADEEIMQANIQSPFHVGKNDIEETKDLEFAKLHKTGNGYLLHYHGGYSVLVNDKLLSTASVLQQIMDGVPEDASVEVNPETGMSEKDGIELMLSAAEMVFRLPMFVFSHPATTLNLATIGMMYMNLLQKIGEVPTEETENPEYDKFLLQMNEMIENLAAGLEKEGRAYEERMGYAKQEKENQSDGEVQGKGEIQAE